MMGLGKGKPQAIQPTPEVTNASSEHQNQVTPETPKLNFQYESTAQQVGGDLPYQLTIGVTIDGAMQGFQLRIVCDAACKFESLNLGPADLGKAAGSTSSRQIDDRTIEVGLNQEFNSSQQCRIVLRGATAFHVSAINKM